MPSRLAGRCALAVPVLLASLLLGGSVLMAAAASVAAQEVVTNETVIQMTRAGLSEGVILAKIRSGPTRFDTRMDALIALKQAGVSEKVMAAIAGGGAPQGAAAAGVAGAPPGRKGPVFHVIGGKQVELIASGGERQTTRVPYNRKTELVLYGSKASYRTTERQPVFLCSADPGEMPLVRLQPGSHDRNLKYSTSTRMPYAGSTTQKGIRSEDRIDVESERDPRGLFRVRPRAPLPPGEYAFVLTRSAGTVPSGAVYDFGVD